MACAQRSGRYSRSLASVRVACGRTGGQLRAPASSAAAPALYNCECITTSFADERSTIEIWDT